MGITLRDGNIITSVISLSSQTPTPTPVEEYDPLVYTLSSDGTYYIIGTGFTSVEDIQNNVGTETNTSGLKSDYIEKWNKSYLIIPATHNGLPVKGVASMALRNVVNITDIIFEDNGVTTIGRYGLAGHPYDAASIVKNIILPNSLTFAGMRAFGQNQYMKSISLPDSLTELSAQLFAFCFGLSNVYFSMNSELTSIGLGAFYQTNLSTIFIPANVSSINTNYGLVWSSIGDSNTSGSLKLSRIVVSSYNNLYADYGYNCIVNKDTKELIAGCAFTYIPENNSNNVKSIGTAAFIATVFSNNCGFLIPSSITDIIDAAFQQASFESKLEFSNDNPGLTLHDSAFYGAKIYLGTSLPDNVSLGNGVFELTYFDGSISLGRTVSIPEKTFNGAFFDHNAGITIPETVTSIGYMAFANMKFESYGNGNGISFSGTMSQWNNITLDSNWRVGSPVITEIICSDGSVSVPVNYAETWVLNVDITTSPTLAENNSFVSVYPSEVHDIIGTNAIREVNTDVNVVLANETSDAVIYIPWSNWVADETNRTIKFFNPVDLTSEFGQWLQLNGVKQ